MPSGLSFTQWIVTVEKVGNIGFISFNNCGNMDASVSMVKFCTIPVGYRPKIKRFVSYSSQHGIAMLLTIDIDGSLELFNNGVVSGGFILRQSISYRLQ